MSSPVSYGESGLPRDSIYQVIRPDGSLTGGAPDVSPDTMMQMYKGLLLARALDRRIVSLSMRREIGSYPSCMGQEATQVGFTSALSSADWFAPMYRDSAAMVTFGFPPENVMGYFAGDERAMRIPEGLNLLPVASPVSAQIPHAVGVAQAVKIRKEKSVVLVSTGDGGTSKGDFHEGLNFAGVNRLPMVFAVENNQWALSVPRKEQTASKTIAQKALAYGFEGILVDGNDLVASYLATRAAVEKARRGDGPTLIEYSTYRLGPHATADLVSDRLKPPEERDEWEKKDPVFRIEAYLSKTGVLDQASRTSMAASTESSVERAVASFRSVQPPDPADVFRFVYDRPTASLAEQWEKEAGGKPSAVEEGQPESRIQRGKPGVNIRNAVNMALKQEMERESRIVLYGEDVGRNGGVFQVTRGLQEEFGQDRVFDTPLSEACIGGMFFGLSIGGLIPVAEFQFDGFTYSALDHVIGHVARLRNRTRGRYSARGVIRFPYGGGVKAPEHHSESPEVFFSHFPGLKVVVPSNPYDAKGLLASSLRDLNPVVFMEPKKLYDSPKESVPEEEYLVPLGKAKVVAIGDDVTLVSYGAMMAPTLAAAEELQGYSISAEVIDLRTVSPMDMTTILDSVKKTGRAVIVHEAQRNIGVGAEISARLVEKALEYLKAPIRRVTGYDTFVPLAKLEDVYLPNKERIVRASLETMSY